MSKIIRKDQQVFASAAGDESIAKFGSLAAGSPEFTTDPDEIQNDEYKGGWESAVIGQASPTMEDRNSLDYLFSRQLAYLYQTGIPAYSATDTYYKGSIVSFYSTDDDALKLYYSIIDDNTGNSLEDTDKWVEWKSGGGASLPLLTFQFTDHELNDMSWLKANGSWCSGDVYVAAYRHLTNDLGFRYASSTLTVSHHDYDAGTYVRISDLDTTISNTTYYCWGISGTTDPTKCIFTLTTTLAGGVKVFAYKDASTIYQLTAGIVTSQTETIAGTTITFYKAQDGHKIALGDQASNALAIYQAAGISWYYIYDSTNTRFKLPRSNWNFKATSDNNTGDFVDQSLPNITGEMSVANSVGFTDGSMGTGVFTIGNTTFANVVSGSATTTYSKKFDASRSSSIYQDNANVQEKATRAFLYFYVGTFEQAAIEQTAGLNQEDFQQKADTDLGNIDSDGKAMISAMSIPGNTIVPITKTASPMDFTAPDDGFMFAKATALSGQTMQILLILYQKNASTLDDAHEVLSSRCISTGAASCFIPVAKGQTVRFVYANVNTSSPFLLNFVYAKGNEPQS